MLGSQLCGALYNCQQVDCVEMAYLPATMSSLVASSDGIHLHVRTCGKQFVISYDHTPSNPLSDSVTLRHSVLPALFSCMLCITVTDSCAKSLIPPFQDYRHAQ